MIKRKENCKDEHKIQESINFTDLFVNKQNKNHVHQTKKYSSVMIIGYFI